MSYKIKQIDHPRYLHLKISGLWTSNNAEEIIDEIARLFLEGGHSRALLDCVDLNDITSVILDYQQAEYTAMKFRGKPHKIAVLETDEVVKERAFFENVAVNRGLNYKEFAIRKDAIDWLLQGA